MSLPTVDQLQRRTIRVLVASQILGGIGVGAGIAVVSLLAYELTGTAALSGIPATAMTVGAAVAALGIARLSLQGGRRTGLVGGYIVGVVGAALAVVAAVAGSFALHVVASFSFGWANAANLQARFAATDLAPEDKQAAPLATVIWATTVGAVLGPNLTDPGAFVAGVMGLPAIAGPYVFSGLAFAGAAMVQAIWLRPDPLTVARDRRRETLAPVPGAPASVEGVAAQAVEDVATLGGSWRTIRAAPAARSALVSIAAAHATMVGVMIMTPVHMDDHGATLRLVGLTISLHIAGMYALSPVFGHMADRFGRKFVLLAGFVQLAAAVVLAGIMIPVGGVAFQVGLVLLGTGWSCCLVAGSALLTGSLRAEDRPAAQGVSDLAMNLAAGLAGIAAGIVLGVASYPALAFGALAVIVVPALMVLRDVDASGRRADVGVAG